MSTLTTDPVVWERFDRDQPIPTFSTFRFFLGLDDFGLVCLAPVSISQQATKFMAFSKTSANLAPESWLSVCWMVELSDLLSKPFMKMVAGVAG